MEISVRRSCWLRRSTVPKTRAAVLLALPPLYLQKRPRSVVPLPQAYYSAYQSKGPGKGGPWSSWSKAGDAKGSWKGSYYHGGWGGYGFGSWDNKGWGNKGSNYWQKSSLAAAYGKDHHRARRVFSRRVRYSGTLKTCPQSWKFGTVRRAWFVVCVRRCRRVVSFGMLCRVVVICFWCITPPVVVLRLVTIFRSPSASEEDAPS